MNKDFDTLLCLLDGKITAYRMKNPYKWGEEQFPDIKAYARIIALQKEIQALWKLNKEDK